MNSLYLYSLDFPSYTKNLYFRDITTKEQIDLEKINIYYPQDIDFYLNYYESLFKIINNCVDNSNNAIKNLNIIEFLLLAIKIRTVSIGNLLEFNVDSGNEEIKNAKIKIDLNETIANILAICTKSLEIKEVEEKNIKVSIDWPNINSIEFFYHLYFSQLSNEERIFESLPDYVKTITIENEEINLSKFNHNQKEEIYNKLPASIQKKVEQGIIKNMNNLMNCDIFNIPHLKNEKLNFYNLSFIRLLRMFFTQNTRRLYEEVYILSNFNLNTNYVLNLTPIERKLYLSFIEQQQKSNQPQQPEQQNFGKPSSAVDDLAVEFGDIPPN